MESVSWSALGLHLALGFSLAAVTGFRAFLPLLTAGVAARLGVIPLAAGFDWLRSDEALWILGAAALIELLGDKVPAVDHILDGAGLLVKPVAACLVMAAPLLELDTKWATVLALLTGSSVAGAIHLARSQLRLVSTVTTAGLGNPLLSVTEDAVGLGGSILAIFLPVLTFFLAAVLVVLLIRLGLGWRNRRKSLQERVSGDMPT